MPSTMCCATKRVVSIVYSAHKPLHRVLSLREEADGSCDNRSEKGEASNTRSRGSPCGRDPSGSGHSYRYRRSYVCGVSTEVACEGEKRDAHLGRDDNLRTVDIELLENPTHLLLRFSVRIDLCVIEEVYAAKRGRKDQSLSNIAQTARGGFPTCPKQS